MPRLLSGGTGFWPECGEVSISWYTLCKVLERTDSVIRMYRKAVVD